MPNNNKGVNNPAYAHGHSLRGHETKEYRAWKAMKTRCNNPNSDYYYLYGGAGITICKEWQDDFLAFYNHIGPCPSPKHSIDRIDGTKGYVPGNVRWATSVEQGRNQHIRSDNTSGCKGVSYIKKRGKWSARISIEGKRKFLGVYDTLEDAIQARKEAEDLYW